MVVALAVSALVAAPAAVTASVGVGAGSLSLCGNQPIPTPRAITHVIVIMLENRSYDSVVNNTTGAPYESGTLALQCGVGSETFGATHWSGANYLATTGGQYPAASPKGCGSVAACATGAASLFSQLDAVGTGWKNYVEGMPTPCDHRATTNYKLGHNPAIFYTALTDCATDDVPVADLTARSGAFWDDLQTRTLPAFSWLTPSQADNGEGKGGLLASDTWLNNVVGLIEQSNDYQSGNTLVLVSYDEGTGDDAVVGEDCTNETADLAGRQLSCRVPLFVIYPYTPPGKDATFFDLYSLTKTVEDLFALPYLFHAGDPQTASLLGHFGLLASNPSPSPTPTPTPVLGQYVRNGSVEASRTGWSGYNARSVLTRVLDGFDGLYSLRVTNKSANGGTIGFIDEPRWLASAHAGVKYTGSVWVKAGSIGEKLTFALRELTPGGASVARKAVTYLAAGTSWHRLTLTYAARSSGDAIGFNVYARAPGDGQFEADQMSLLAPGA